MKEILKKNIKYFDTTIRDGELSTNFNPTSKDRLEIALSLENAGVDVIELASTADSKDRIVSSQKIAGKLTNTTICCLSQLTNTDLEVAKSVLDESPNSRIHLYLDAKRVHLIEERSGDYHEAFEAINTIVGAAKNHFSEVEFSPQDATRISLEPLSRIVGVAFNAGANIINIPDTVGSSTPETIKLIFRKLLELNPDLSSVELSLHAHNNLGRSIENVMAAIECGVTQIEGTINGVGPAGGNTVSA